MDIELSTGPDGIGGLDFKDNKVNSFQVSYIEDAYNKPQLRINVGRGLVVNFSISKYMLRDLKNRIESVINE